MVMMHCLSAVSLFYSTDINGIIYFLCDTILGIKIALSFGRYYTTVQIWGSVWFIFKEYEKKCKDVILMLQQIAI